MPDVSVVLPTFNRAHMLEPSLASILQQGGVELEVVVVDDGSTDGTAALLAGIGDARVRVLRGAHAGIPAARNRGLAAARAPFVAFHDSDDVALPGRLAIPVGHLRQHPELDLVIQNGRLLPPGGSRTEREKPWLPPQVARSLAGRTVGVAEVFRWNLGQLQGMCFTRRCLDAVNGFDPALDILEDLDLVLRVTTRFAAEFLDVPAFAYRRHPEGVTWDRARVREVSIRVAEKLVREHPEVLEVLGRRTFRRRQARRWASLARLRVRDGDRAGARVALSEARALERWNVSHRLQALWLRLGGRA